MPDLASHVLAINSEPRLLVGTRTGRVIDCAVGGDEALVAFAGLEGVGVRAAAVSQDGALVMAFDTAGRGLVWDRRTGDVVDELRSARPVIQCAVVAPGDYLTLCNDKSAHVWSRGTAGATSIALRESPDVKMPVDTFGVPADGARVLLLDGFRWSTWDRRTRSVSDSHMPIDGMHVDNPSGDIGLSRNGRFYYTYWDKYLVIDTSDRRVVRERQVIVDPITSALSNDGRVLVVGARDGVVVAVGPEGEAVFDSAPGGAVVLQVSIGDDGRLATFVDEEGGAGCVDVEAGALLISREQMGRILA